MIVLKWAIYFIFFSIVCTFKMLVNGDMGSVETFIKGPIESSPYNLDTCPIINDPNKGLLNYRRTICASKSYLDETDLYVILGDVVYPETNSDKVKPNVPVSDEENKNRLIKMRNKLQNQEIYKGRLICGWAGLKSLLVNYHNICGGSSNPEVFRYCLLYTSPSPRDRQKSRMPSSA